MTETKALSTHDEIEAWLLAYAWNGTAAEQAANVACIMRQDDWQYIDARTERYASQAEDSGPASWLAAHEHALSALYECHDGPHSESCPDAIGYAPQYMHGICRTCTAPFSTLKITMGECEPCAAATSRQTFCEACHWHIELHAGGTIAPREMQQTCEQTASALRGIVADRG